MFSASKLFTFALAATSAFAATYQDVLNDLAAVDQTTVQLGTLADQYTGTGAQSLAIQQKVSTLINQINQAKTDTNNSPVPTTAQAQQVLNYINGQLFTDTTNTLTKTKNKRTAFTNAGIKPQIKTYLTNTKNAVDGLADALIAKAPTAALKSSGQTSKANYDAKFNDAITYFS